MSMNTILALTVSSHALQLNAIIYRTLYLLCMAVNNHDLPGQDDFEVTVVGCVVFCKT